MISSEDDKLVIEKENLNHFINNIMPNYTSEPVLKQIPIGFLIYNALSEEECNFLMKNIDYSEDVMFQNENGIYRKNKRNQIENKALADAIFNRIKHLLVDKLTYTEDVKELGPLSKGTWVLSALNPKVRLCKYESGGFFGKHYDGCYIINPDERSFYTIMCYLNEDFEEGETVFTEGTVVKPTKGMMVFFQQDLWHEGRKCIGEKYILRTDVIYKRESGFEGLSEEISKEKQALIYFEMAQEMERCKNGKAAVEFYRKAFKLDPELENKI
jgi:hypothetical protein